MAERGRGAGINPHNRFERLELEPDRQALAEAEAAWEEEPRRAKTVFLRDDSQSVLAKNAAGDLSFVYGLNPYRGCEHGCAYCYARTYHEYLGFSSGLDFESKIIVKPRAPELLERELARAGYRPGKIMLSGVTDCYQPVERRLGLTGRCLEVLARFRNPVGLITKNAWVTRDLAALQELARHDAVCVYLSVTTLDPALARILEPRASSPRSRLGAMRQLAEAGIPVGASVAPLIPGLNDTELPSILAAARDHGASFAQYTVVRLPGSVAEVFADWLGRYFPARRDKVLKRIRSAHGGRLNSAIPAQRLRGTDEDARQLRALFHACCHKLGLAPHAPELNLAAFRRLQPGQGELF